MGTIRTLCLLIIPAGAIPAASHFTALSLFNSYVIAHERTALEELYIVSECLAALSEVVDPIVHTFVRTGRINSRNLFAIVILRRSESCDRGETTRRSFLCFAEAFPHAPLVYE